MAEDRDEALETSPPLPEDARGPLEIARAGAVLAEAESRAHVVPPAALAVEAEPNAVQPSADADRALGDPLPAPGAQAESGGEEPAALESATATTITPTASADAALGDPLPAPGSASGAARDGTDPQAEAAWGSQQAAAEQPQAEAPTAEAQQPEAEAVALVEA
ncbi:MAG: hypothetical protein JO023_22720, partial [Chloroflexi bacterium]|nr:hypothetical protein [Chloroflexota bacterium]